MAIGYLAIDGASCPTHNEPDIGFDLADYNVVSVGSGTFPFS